MEPFTSELLLDFRPDTTIDDIAKALERLLDRSGCPACGRLSVHIRAVDDLDPVFHELEGIKGLRSVLELDGPLTLASGRR